jgi:hypothetical protein
MRNESEWMSVVLGMEFHGRRDSYCMGLDWVGWA